MNDLLFTSVRPIRESYQPMCALVAKLIPTLDWRHNGLGVLQAYVYEGAREELRVHIWHPSLRRDGIEDSGLLHDHRFSMTSRVLLGTIEQVEFLLRTDHERGPWVIHEVVHARAAAGSKHAPNDGLVTELPGRWSAEQSCVYIGEGQVYSFPKRQFHGTYPQSDLVVTLVSKTEQEDSPARIMAPHGRKVVHAFAEPQPRESWQWILDEAVRKLDARARVRP